MSRIAKKPIELPAGVDFNCQGQEVKIKGKKGEFNFKLDDAVALKFEDKKVFVTAKKDAHPMVGTTRKLLGNMIKGVAEGFEKKLKLEGVGYRAKVQGNVLELSLGFSHPVQLPFPVGVVVEAPSNIELNIKGADLEAIGEFAAKIRSVRPPEPYKGKGVRYADEKIVLKETKKK